MSLTSRPQRLAREGLFLLVQGQTTETRRAHLHALTAERRRSAGGAGSTDGPGTTDPAEP